MKPKIAVILFPGLNCELESKRACEAAGMDADIIRWNQPVNLGNYDGYLIPGGWSYEDRIRAGAIAAKDPLMLKIKEEAKKGKLVIGICNGCQVLVESDIIPGLRDKVEMALAPNINSRHFGYYCDWTRIKNTGKKTAFNSLYKDNEIIDIPIAHGEGRFTTKDKKLLAELEKNRQIIFKYCDKEGNITKEANPNGSMENIAGISNRHGNVLAMMPHPERGMFYRQLVDKEHGKDGDELTKAALIFKSMKKYIEEHNG